MSAHCTLHPSVVSHSFTLRLKLIGYSRNFTWLVTSRHDTYNVSSASWRACRAVLVPTCRTTKKQYARVYKFSLCVLDLHQSQEQLLVKVRLTCPPQSQSRLWRRPWTRVVRVALVVIAPCCPTSATSLVTSRHNFSLCQNSWAR